MAEYPQLTAADVQACLGYAARAVDERELLATRIADQSTVQSVNFDA
jgi:hypothetical protein